MVVIVGMYLWLRKKLLKSLGTADEIEIAELKEKEKGLICFEGGEDLRLDCLLKALAERPSPGQTFRLIPGLQIVSRLDRQIKAGSDLQVASLSGLRIASGSQVSRSSTDWLNRRPFLLIPSSPLCGQQKEGRFLLPSRNILIGAEARRSPPPLFHLLLFLPVTDRTKRKIIFFVLAFLANDASRWQLSSSSSGQLLLPERF
ncbi:hypothetical protein ZIOFF_041193 [Zingiber officinale]|uniref:Uncharacterized protein n=1 Tax=Zingiber officinale TaxID=94328 RepID=A0A8J5GB62_ZINOF|nr:hypothetical protein ZIOFF_041193 [Zingiber officinale]